VTFRLDYGGITEARIIHTQADHWLLIHLPVLDALLQLELDLLPRYPEGKPPWPT